MKVIIAGSKSIDHLPARRWDCDQLIQRNEAAIQASGFVVAEIITGGAGNPDRAGEQWAAKNGTSVTMRKPNWRLGRGAGWIANRQLAEAGEALIPLHHGENAGTLDKIEHLKAAGMPVYVVTVSS